VLSSITLRGVVDYACCRPRDAPDFGLVASQGVTGMLYVSDEIGQLCYAIIGIGVVLVILLIIWWRSMREK